MRDLRLGMYGLNADELEQADRLGLSAWGFAEQCKGVGAEEKPLTDEQKRAEWKRLFAERLSDHSTNLKSWRDGDNNLWLGWFRTSGCGQQFIIVIGKVHTESRTVVAVPMRREATDAADGVVWWRPWMANGVWDKISSWRRIVPPGVF